MNGDTVYLNAASGAITVTLTGAAACTVFDATGFTGTLALAIYGLTVAGNCTLPSGMTITYSSNAAITVSAAATVTGGTSSGVRLFLTGSGAVTLNSAGTTWDVLKVTGGAKTVTLSSALAATVLNLWENFTSTTFAGAYNITVGTLGMGYNSAITVTFPSGQTVTVTSALFALSPTGTPLTVRSGTSSSPFNLTYTGAVADCNVNGVVFTDVDASGSTGGGLVNWCGSTLTRTTGITNRTSADIGGSGAGAWAHRMIAGGF